MKRVLLQLPTQTRLDLSTKHLLGNRIGPSWDQLRTTELGAFSDLSILARSGDRYKRRGTIRAKSTRRAYGPTSDKNASGPSPRPADCGLFQLQEAPHLGRYCFLAGDVGWAFSAFA